jgi:hypothetical protein
MLLAMQAGSLRGVMEQLERSGNKREHRLEISKLADAPETAHCPQYQRHGKQDMQLAVGTNSHVMLRSVPLPAGGRIAKRRTQANTGVGWWIGPFSAAQTEHHPDGLQVRGTLCFQNPGDALRGINNWILRLTLTNGESQPPCKPC